ncbi:hypothetical protein GALMADRAFT_248978 [Galerina marginata CBS 339.88]|uniref:CUE domain-containing protein n=1 Tax=Galerina marginata (strain CBS 339.88) TaxID=685588 RepID=A0A067T591_GALM3|nr:hypothetical protein GALMADRAFT_248978 [Galerina marginata CBS 339.88]
MADDSPAPAPVQTPPNAPSPPQTERDTVVDPRVVALRGLFPDYDDLILQSVLQSANGNQDRAIDVLLGMSDPDYRSEQPAQTSPQPVPALSQEDLDEQFARQLVMQEQQQQQARWMQSQPQGGPAVYQRPAGRGGGAWAPAPGSQQPQPQQGQGQAPMAEFQEQFIKIAETGKKTFGNIFSKVKAKIQELDQGNSRIATSSSQPTMQQQWSPPALQPQPHQPAAYFDPNPNPNISPSVSPARTPASQVQGYDVGASPSPPTSQSPPPLASTPSISTNQQLQPQPTPHPQPTPPISSAATPPPPATSQGAPIDVGKLGLLPKRPVSLLRDPNAGSPSPPVIAASHSGQSYNDDDDGLEYAENPFEDDGKGGKK